jgi:hypothetical protein
MSRPWFTLVLLLTSVPVLAADKKAPPTKKPAEKTHVKLDGMFNMPGAELPKDSLEKKTEKLGDAPKESVGNATYDVVKVAHGRAFMRSPSGSTAQGGELQELSLTGNPPTTDKFTTVIRVKSKARNNVPIEVAIVDPRGDTVMSSGSGTLVFFGSKQDEIDYQIDWEPTALRSGGDYKVLIRVANEVKGTWPLKVAQK